MSGTFNLIKEFMSALNASEQNKTQPYDTQGTVKRVEGDTAWVQFTGSDRETPIQMTIACDVGDTVQARIGGGSAWLTGNLTAPPTDDKKANQAISMVTNIAETVQETVDEALEDIASVDDVTMQYCLSTRSDIFVQDGDWSNTPPAYQVNRYYWTRTVLYDEDGNPTYGTPQYSQDTQLSVETDVAFKSNNNHFWYDSSGAYVTTQNKSYATGSAVRITASGILQQVNGSTVSSWTNSGISFLQGGSTVASFGSGGVSLYSGGTEATYIGTQNGAPLARFGWQSSTRLEFGGDYLEMYNSSNTKQVTLDWGTSGSYSFARLTTALNRLYISGPHIELYSYDYLTTSTPIYVGSYKLLTTGTVTATGSVSANSTGSGTASASKSGYTPIGILGFEPSGSNYGHLNIYSMSLSGSTVTWRGFNFGSSTADVTMTITVLYIATTQGV